MKSDYLIEGRRAVAEALKAGRPMNRLLILVLQFLFFVFSKKSSALIYRMAHTIP